MIDVEVLERNERNMPTATAVTFDRGRREVIRVGDRFRYRTRSRSGRRREGVLTVNGFTDDGQAAYPRRSLSGRGQAIATVRLARYARERTA